MKILLLNYEYPPVGGGGGVSTKVLSESWVELGNQVTVVTSGYKNLPYYSTENGVGVYRVPVLLRTELATATIPSMLSYLPSAFLSYLLKTIEFDVINTHFAIPTGPLGDVISRLSHKPNILSIHGADIYDPSRFSPNDHPVTTKFNSYLLDSANQVVAQSSNTEANAKQYYSSNFEVEVIPLAYSLFKFKPISRQDLGLDPSKKYLIGVGRLVKRKGFEYLIQALDLLKDENVELIIVGFDRENRTRTQHSHLVSYYRQRLSRNLDSQA